MGSPLEKPKASKEEEWGGFPLPNRSGGLGSVVSSPADQRGPGKNGFGTLRALKNTYDGNKLFGVYGCMFPAPFAVSPQTDWEPLKTVSSS